MNMVMTSVVTNYVFTFQGKDGEYRAEVKEHRDIEKNNREYCIFNLFYNDMYYKDLHNTKVEGQLYKCEAVIEAICMQEEAIRKCYNEQI